LLVFGLLVFDVWFCVFLFVCCCWGLMFFVFWVWFGLFLVVVGGLLLVVFGVVVGWWVCCVLEEFGGWVCWLL
jgi:hypothetical protein